MMGQDITFVLLTCWEMYDICRTKGLVPGLVLWCSKGTWCWWDVGGGGNGR